MHIHPRAIVVRDFCRHTFHRRSDTSLDLILRRAGVPALTGIDTRALTIAIRDSGTCRAWIGAGDPEKLVEKARSLTPIGQVDWVSWVTTNEVYEYPRQPEIDDPFEVAVLDCGVKKSILNRLVDEGCRIRVFPADSKPEDLLAGPTEGVFLSNGPGNPSTLPHLVHTVGELIASGIPLFGICLGHQLIARALGGTTTKLPFGHHGANHPVQRVSDGKIEITSQNHNYAVPAKSLDPTQVNITHKSLNDNSVEGLEAIGKSVYSVQYHPEAAPGPSDSLYLFARFRKDLLEYRNSAQNLTYPEVRSHAAQG